jgi:membrane fusion protein (multidrug efflux system)
MAIESSTGNQPPPGDGPRRHRRPRAVIAAVALVLVGLGLYYGARWVVDYFRYVSTDDAYVSGYISYLGPRIASRVEEVLVKEVDFIRAGEVLVRLDSHPFRVAVEGANAELQLAQANLAEARATVRAQLSTARANEYLTRTAVDQVRSQVAGLRAALAEQKLDEANLALAEKDFARNASLVTAHAVSQEAYDQSAAALQAARSKVTSQQEAVQRIRAELGLARDIDKPGEVPRDIELHDARVQVALSNWATSLIRIGVPLNVLGQSAEAVRQQLDEWMARQISGKTLDAIVENAPAVQVALAKVRQAEAALAAAELNLGYTEIRAPFDGFVTKRSVNPGDYVSAGQNLLAVQSLRDVWVDANFKETEIHRLRIGLPVDVYVDAYPGRVFAARVAGFSPATGSRLSLLPPENATGNFVKVVQRLPVRIEFEEPPPVETPLFVGLSVEPEVHFKAQPRGPHAGERLRLPRHGARPAAAAQPGSADEAAADQAGGRGISASPAAERGAAR